MHRINWKLLLCFGVLLLVGLTLAACEATATPAAPTEPPPPTEVPPTATEPPPPPTATPLPDQSAFLADWQSGPHAENYDLGKGPNTWCSRCHSPQNWDPEAFRGPPPACFTCKFPTDEEVRIAEGNPLVLEEDWVGIPCETCHRMTEGVATENAWFNPIKGEHEDVATTTELCEKCHVTTTGNSFGSAVTHKVTLGGSAHLNYGGFLGETPPPTYCTDCHNPHTTEPLQCATCHEDVPTSADHIKGLNAIHLDKVTCMACHDADEMEVGPHPDEAEGGVFVTLVSSVGRGGPSIDYVKSHSIKWEVSCDRCHFEENPWELTVLTADGMVPEETTD